MTTTETLRIGYLPILDHLTLPIAAQNAPEKFKRLDVQIVEFANWDELATAFRTGKLEAAFLLAPLAMEQFRTDPMIRVILLGHREGQVLTVRKGIERLDDLKDNTIRLPHRFSTHHLLLAEAFRRAHLSLPDDAHLEFGFDNLREAADELAGGQADAFLLAEPMGTDARRRGLGQILSTSQEILSHHVDCVLVTRQPIIQDDSERITTLITQLVEAGAFINGHPRRAAELATKSLGWPVKTIIEALSHHRGHIIFWDLLPRLQDFQALQALGLAARLWDATFDLARLVEPRFALEAYRNWTISHRQSVDDRGTATALPGNFAEAAKRLDDQLKDTFETYAVSVIKSGQRYPKAWSRRIFSANDPLALLTQVAKERQLVLTDLPGAKGLTVSLNPESTNPDAVLLKTSRADRVRLEKAIGLIRGKTGDQFQRGRAATELFAIPIVATLYETDDADYLILPWNVFRFIVLGLSYF